MDSRTLETITRLTARERLLIASLRGATMDEDQADIALLRGDVPDPDEGW
jgi:hypothetical protein